MGRDRQLPTRRRRPDWSDLLKWRALPAAVFVLALASSAAARVRVCVDVDAGKSDAAALRRLVMSEVDRHPTHRAVDSGCESHLRVELDELDASMGGERFLTARLDGEVPAREAVGRAGMGPALERLITVVLHNDPRRLDGPERDDWIGRTRAAFLRRGTMSVGVELYETSAIVDGRLQALSGVAISGRRELDRIHLGLRVGAASAFEAPHDRLTLTQEFLGQLELAAYGSAEAATAGFAALALGLEVQRFQAPDPGAPSNALQSVTSAGAALGLRGGVELFRTTSTRFQLFAQVLLPAFVSHDSEHALVSQWTPTLALGVGGWL